FCFWVAARSSFRAVKSPPRRRTHLSSTMAALAARNAFAFSHRERRMTACCRSAAMVALRSTAMKFHGSNERLANENQEPRHVYARHRRRSFPRLCPPMGAEGPRRGGDLGE